MTNSLKKQIKLYQIIIILYFICHGSLCGVASTLIINLGHENCWISPIIGAILGIIPFLITIFILEKYPNKNIFQIIDFEFGKIIGKIINFILILFVCSYLIIFYWNFTNFISSQYLYNTPQGFIAILFIIPIIYLLSKGITVILRSSIIIFILSFSFFSISALALIPQMNIQNIMPVLANGVMDPIKAGVLSIGYLTLPTMLISCIPKDSYVDTKNFKKKLIISYILIQMTIELIIFGIISVFGVELSLLYQYPEFQILRRVTIGGFIERVESTLSIHWILDLFMLIIFLSYFIKIGITQVFNIKKEKTDKYLLNIFIIFLILLSLKAFPSNTSANTFFIKNYPIYCFIFLLGINVIVFIASKIKKKHSN